MINTKVSCKYELGTKLETVEKYGIIPAGWNGIVEDRGITADGFSYEYKIRGADGNIQIIVGNILRPYIEGTRKEIKSIYDNLSLFFNDEVEEKDYFKMRSMATLGREDPLFLALTMYQYGKTQGKSQERLERKRKELMMNYPDMRETTMRASNKVIEIAYKMETLSQEERELLIDFITKEKELENHPRQVN